MSPESYEADLLDIARLLERGNLEEAGVKIQVLRQCKPVRLELDLLDAIHRYKKSGNLNDFFYGIRGKYTLFYAYESQEKCMRECIQRFADIKNVLDEHRHQFILQSLQRNDQQYSKFEWSIPTHMDAFACEKDRFSHCYILNDFLSAFLQQHFLRKTYPNEQDVGYDWLKQITNMGYLAQELEHDDAAPFLVVDHGVDRERHRLALRNLRALGKVAYYLAPSEHEGKFLLADGDGHEIACADGWFSLLQRVRDSFSKMGLVNVIANGHTTEILSRHANIAKTFQRMIGQQEACFQRNLMLSWYGDYLSYISKIYLEDCHSLVDRRPTKRFSIVIPARNSAETLRYTLQTCLEQTYGGDYEIVISDNSTGKNGEVYALCQELHDSHIVYLKTPRDLYLPKSFEYAFLHTAGEYVLPLGSDDGLLPWALEELDRAVSQFPGEEIIQWERGSYIWPGLHDGREHHFFIPKKYTRDIVYRRSEGYLSMILRNYHAMYELPLLYINSCFRRSYFQTLLKKTGRLWDGMSQDVYIGIVNICLHAQILNLAYPLTIAALSSGSVGISGNAAKTTDKALNQLIMEQQRDSNIGGYCKSYDEFLLPEHGTDVTTLYACLLRMISLGILPEEYLTSRFDWKAMFEHIFSVMDPRDVAYDRRIHEMRYAAMLHGEEFLAWFDETIYLPGMKPRRIDERDLEQKAKEKNYQEGTNARGGISLDASKYGVENIHDAVKLFMEKMDVQKRKEGCSYVENH